MTEPIYLSEPKFCGKEWEYVKECLDSGWVSSAGGFVGRFEQEIAAFLNVKHAIATVNGTAALHIGLLLIGVQPNDEVLMPTLSFIAPANAVKYVGAYPVFIDVESDYWQIDTEQMRRFLRDECHIDSGVLRNKLSGRRISAILPVHILGHPCDTDSIKSVANEYGLPVLGDATESLGAKYKGRPAGSLEEISCLSYNGNKIMTAGGGGMIVTNNDLWAERAKYLTTQAKDDPFEYIHTEVGYNYRMPNVLAAIGCAQLETLSRFVEAKRRIAEKYAVAFDEIPGIRIVKEAPWAFSTYWLYTILIDEAEFGMSSRCLAQRLAAQDVQSRCIWQPLHRSLAHEDSPQRDCPVADQLFEQALSLPSSVGLSSFNQDRVITAVIAAKESLR